MLKLHSRSSTLKPHVRTALAGLLLCMGTAAACAQEVIRLNVAAGHPQVFLWVKHVHESFLPAVDAELARTGKYRIVWNEAYGGTLAKPGSELETMQQGVSDLGIVSTVFHPSKMPLNNVTYFVPYGPQDVTVVTKAMEQVQAQPEMIAEWNKYGLVYLAGFSLDNYGVVSKFPISKAEDFQGKRLGGAGPNFAWFKNTGAVGVQSALPTWYNDIKSGVSDGAITFITAAVPAKLFEVAPYYTVTNMGAMYAGAVAINKARWDKLPEEVRQAMRKASNTYKAAYLFELTSRVETATAEWKRMGTVMNLPPAEQARMARLIPNPTAEWISKSGSCQARARGLHGRRARDRLQVPA